MLRLGVVLGLALWIGGSAVAHAQAPGQSPPMPIATDLSKVAAGSWAEYSMAMGTLPAMKMRMAMVGKTPAANVLETSVEGGMMAAAGKMVMQMTVTPGTDASVKKMVMQIGAGDPMEMKLEMAGDKPFTKPNAKGLVGSETIKVPAGSFKTKHYRDKTPQGEKLEYWVVDSVPPFGLVKMEYDQKNNPQIKGKLVLELTGQGKDAKPLITKPPKPFDQAALLQQMMAASGAGSGPPPGKAAAPPAAPPPPSPAPKK